MSKETFENLKKLAHLADKADGKVDGKIQRNSIDNLRENLSFSEKISLASDPNTLDALKLFQSKIPKDAKTFNVPTDKEIRDIVAKVENAAPKPVVTPCEETWIGGLFKAPDWLPDGMKTKVCPKR